MKTALFTDQQQQRDRRRKAGEKCLYASLRDTQIRILAAFRWGKSTY
jgi:hypothetical protein